MIVSEHREVSSKPRKYAVAGGTVVVRTVEDPECPDPLAKSRRPVIVVAAFIPGARDKDVRTSDVETLLTDAAKKCRGVDAPGSWPGLQLPLPENLKSINDVKSSYRPLVVVVPVILLGLVFICFAIVIPKISSLKELLRGLPANENNISEWASAAETQLEHWGIQDLPPESNAIKEFLALMARNEKWGQLNGGHVDSEYLRRFPNPVKPLDRNPKESDVRKAMVRLLNNLEEMRETTEDSAEPKVIIEKIADAVDYRYWYTSDSRDTAFSGRAHHLSDEARSYIYRFCPSATGIENSGLCKALYHIMTDQWAIEGLCEDDLQKRPWFVAGCFFEFISLDAVPTEDVSSTEEELASATTSDSTRQSTTAVVERLQKYLPTKCLLNKADLRNDSLELPINTAIEALARSLDVPIVGRDTRTILEDVRLRLKQIAASILETPSSKDLPETTKWYLERLTCPGPALTLEPSSNAGE
ncbi:MAG: hypothetical protein D6698_13880 [Gammaproteobacteria bacterium]|nr:MAG: hypothetical protein D6698_13880 [Gammaproteobacteria bacterium]